MTGGIIRVFPRRTNMTPGVHVEADKPEGLPLFSCFAKASQDRAQDRAQDLEKGVE